MIYVLLYVLLCIFVGIIAQLKGEEGIIWGIASVIFTPILVGLVLIGILVFIQ